MENPPDYTEEDLWVIRKESKKLYKKKKFRLHRYKGMLAEPGPHSFVTILDQLKPSFNVGKIFRSVQAFGGHSIHVIGLDYFDPGPAKGAIKHVPSKFFTSFDESYEDLSKQNYTFYFLDPAKGDLIGNVDLAKKSAFVLSHEQFGLNLNVEKYDNVAYLRIPQFGKVESLNVSIAASICMYEYVRKYGETETK